MTGAAIYDDEGGGVEDELEQALRDIDNADDSEAEGSEPARAHSSLPAGPTIPASPYPSNASSSVTTTHDDSINNSQSTLPGPSSTVVAPVAILPPGDAIATPTVCEPEPSSLTRGTKAITRAKRSGVTVAKRTQAPRGKGKEKAADDVNTVDAA